jgi:hypothetical protein
VRTFAEVALCVVAAATAIAGVAEALARASISGLVRPVQNDRDVAFPDADVAAGDERVDPAQRFARSLALRPRDPRLLASLASALERTDGAEAVRLRVHAARVAPYDGQLAAVSGTRLLELGRRAVERAALESERAARAAGRPGATEHEAEARSARDVAERAFQAVLDVDAATGPRAPHRRFVLENADEARRRLEELRGATR